MKARTFATASIAAAALALSVATPAFATSPAKPSGKMVVYTHQTQRDALDLGTTGTSVGDVVTGSGSVSTTPTGKTIGAYAFRAETVRVNIPGGTENRLSTTVFTLADGTIMTSGLLSVQGGTRPTKTAPVVIVGGTGSYAGAAGSATLNPSSNETYKVTFTFTS